MAIRRDASFSPNSEEKDRAILQATCDVLGEDIPIVDESRLDESYDADVYLSMARFPQTIQMLKHFEEQGKVVVNSGFAVEACSRSHLQAIMTSHQVPIPPSKGEFGYWIKRGDAAAQLENDVVYCEDGETLKRAQADFSSRGITDVVITAHVKGDVVKFYGVGHHFFQYFYPTDDQQTKFSHERVNGKAHHYAFDEKCLEREVQRLANIITLDVYGGDAIIDKEGNFFIIDFNDWPSFSRCKKEAANAIAQLVKERMT